jgi:hypothetical protein
MPKRSEKKSVAGSYPLFLPGFSNSSANRIEGVKVVFSKAEMIKKQP